MGQPVGKQYLHGQVSVLYVCILDKSPGELVEAESYKM